MRVAIIGAETALGKQFAAEFAARSWSFAALPSACVPTAGDLADFDAVVDAVAPGDNAETHASLLKQLADVMRALPAVRLIALGSAGSLYLDESRTLRVCDLAPEDARGEEAEDSAFAALCESGADWTCFSPAAEFVPDGPRSGRPILGRDIRILDPAGKSRLSYADCAVAIADELERSSFRGRRFTAVSDCSGFPPTPENNLIDLRIKYMFTRRGAYFGISSDVMTRYTGLAYQSAQLYIGSRRGTSADSPAQGKDLIYLTPMYRGQALGYAVRTTPTELILTTAYGEIRACMADDHLLLIRGENGLSLLLHNKMRPREQMKPRGGTAWEGVFRWRCSLILNPLAGALTMDAPWDGKTQTTPSFRGVVEPDADGRFLLAVDESVYAGKIRPAYPTYAEALADVTADWEDFLAHIPETDAALSNTRIEAAWNLWAFLLNPSGFIKRPHIMMAASSIASSWQMSHNAAALRGNLPLALDLLTNMIDSSSPVGQLPDMVDDGRAVSQAIHPPTQGWALKWIMRRHDLAAEAPRETLERMYDGFSRWADWFLFARDDDRDGLPQYDDGDECGFDDSSPFEHHTALETPDLPSYLVVLYDALGDLAEILGKPEARDDWRLKADSMTRRIIETFWNGERFVALTNGTHEVVSTDSLLFYLPFVLGRRLPQEIIDKMTADLLKEGDFLTPYGLCIERMESDFFRLSGMSRGWVLPPSNLLILTGMYDAGKTEEAKMIARRYCDACAKWGLSMLLDPLRGTPNAFACSWAANTFLVLADMACNM